MVTKPKQRNRCGLCHNHLIKHRDGWTACPRCDGIALWPTLSRALWRPA